MKSKFAILEFGGGWIIRKDTVFRTSRGKVIHAPVYYQSPSDEIAAPNWVFTRELATVLDRYSAEHVVRKENA